MSGCCGWVTALSRSSGGAAVFSRYRSGPLYKHPAMLSISPVYLDAHTSIMVLWFGAQEDERASAG